VVRIQGAPTGILDIGIYERWEYGYDSLQISKKDKTVHSWQNQIDGKLRVGF